MAGEVHKCRFHYSLIHFNKETSIFFGNHAPVQGLILSRGNAAEEASLGLMRAEKLKQKIY